MNNCVYICVQVLSRKENAIAISEYITQFKTNQRYHGKKVKNTSGKLKYQNKENVKDI